MTIIVMEGETLTETGLHADRVEESQQRRRERYNRTSRG